MDFDKDISKGDKELESVTEVREDIQAEALPGDPEAGKVLGAADSEEAVQDVEKVCDENKTLKNDIDEANKDYDELNKDAEDLKVQAEALKKEADQVKKEAEVVDKDAKAVERDVKGIVHIVGSLIALVMGTAHSAMFMMNSFSQNEILAGATQLAILAIFQVPAAIAMIYVMFKDIIRDAIGAYRAAHKLETNVVEDVAKTEKSLDRAEKGVVKVANEVDPKSPLIGDKSKGLTKRSYTH